MSVSFTAFPVDAYLDCSYSGVKAAIGAVSVSPYPCKNFIPISSTHFPTFASIGAAAETIILRFPPKLSNISLAYKLYKEDIFIIIVSAMAVFIATKWFYKTKHKKKYLIIICIYYLLIALIPFIYSNIFLFSSFYKYGISLLINLIPVNILILYNAVSKIS